MPYAKLNASGCEIRKERIKLRLDLFLNPADPNYDKHHLYVVDWDSPEAQAGYSGAVGPDGNPVNWADYQAWKTNLPHIWKDRSFHTHMIHPAHNASDDDIKTEITKCLNYFYAFHQYCWDGNKAFMEEWKKVPFQDSEVRHRFIAGKPKDKTKNNNRLQDILSRIEEFDVLVALIPQGINLNIGKKGTIDVGLAAVDRGGVGTLRYDTRINYNNAANDTGTIDTVEAWFDAAQNGNNCRAGSFTDNGSGNFTCHDAESLGEVDDDILQQFTGLTISIATGEFIGIDESNNKIASIDGDTSGHSGMYAIAGDYCDPEDTGDFTFTSGWGLSLYGTGDGAAPTTLELRSVTDTDARLAFDTEITLALRSASDTDARLTISVAISIAGRAYSQTRAAIALVTGVSIALRFSTDTWAAITLTVAEVTELELRSATDTRIGLILDTGIALALKSASDTRAALTISVTAVIELYLRSVTDTRAAITLETLITLALRSISDTRASLALQTIPALACRSFTGTRVSLALSALISLELRSSTSTRAAITLTISLVTEIECRSATATRTAIQLNSVITLALLSRTNTRAALLFTTAFRYQGLNMAIQDRELTMAMRGNQQ